MVALKTFPKDYTPPDWLPNWENEAEYTDHGDDIQSWAWEFLRRNPEYQADYAHYMSVPWCYPGGGKTPKIAGRSINPDASMIYYHAPGRPAREGETFREYEQATGLEPVQLEYYLLQRWEILTLEDPARLAAPSYGPEPNALPPYFLEFAWADLDCGPRNKMFPGNAWLAGRLVVASWPESEDDYVAAVGIDLRYNIKEQLDEIGRILTDRKREKEIDSIRRNGGAHQAGMLICLRMLDGKLRGASYSKLAGLLDRVDRNTLPSHIRGNAAKGLMQNKAEMYQNRDTQAVKECLIKARKFVFGEYQQLLKLAELPQKQVRKSK